MPAGSPGVKAIRCMLLGAMCHVVYKKIKFYSKMTR